MKHELVQAGTIGESWYECSCRKWKMRAPKLGDFNVRTKKVWLAHAKHEAAETQRREAVQRPDGEEWDRFEHFLIHGAFWRRVNQWMLIPAGDESSRVADEIEAFLFKHLQLRAETQRSSHGSEPDEKKGVEAHPAPAGSESTAPICSHCGKPNTLGWTAENVRRGKQFNEATNTLVYHCYERFIED